METLEREEKKRKKNIVCMPTLPPNPQRKKRWTPLERIFSPLIGCMQIIFLTKYPFLRVWVPLKFVESLKCGALDGLYFLIHLFYLLHLDPHRNIITLHVNVDPHLFTIANIFDRILGTKMLPSHSLALLIADHGNNNDKFFTHTLLCYFACV
jgi:hypothetical protein